MKNSKFFLISFILVVLFWVLYLFKPFLMNIAIAGLMAVSTSNINVKFLTIFKDKKVISALATTLFTLALFFIPFVYAIIELAKVATNFDINYIYNTIEYFKNYNLQLPETLSFIEPKIKEILANIDLNSISKNILTYLSSATKFGTKFLTDMVLICVFYFFANLYGSQIISYIKTIIPMQKEETQGILSEVSNVMSVVFYSMVLNAILQGVLFGIITKIYGYDAFLMGIVFCFSSLLPVVGGALIYVPVSLYEFANGNLHAALIIFLYSIITISFIADTLVKPYIIKWINNKLVKIPTQINELLIFFAMIAGISSFGFWGIILGPAILTFFISTLKLYIILKEKHFV
ncbi:acid membrane antigen A [Campylobacter insulaenigrae]|uniref:AI-2E family transporter n=1 Tax=Campylobacter insulaenigrae TaxID=260714 RepID=UPI000F6B7E43|nr:AI-2E family transporter [Campylobacter insulaenigrae]MCR6591427.1 AI-2E family transporter [Campylobacter insulaenigrae]MCR6592972.1 AI-2E family transporter [Campylobacter insulaenigrae]VEJ55029.1 acid membrane antigen A [Campylobacter insulaenigrae]